MLHDTRGPDVAAAPLEFNTGMDEVPEAIDMAVRLMTPGETSLIRAAARYSYDGRSDRPEVRCASRHPIATCRDAWETCFFAVGVVLSRCGRGTALLCCSVHA